MFATLQESRLSTTGLRLSGSIMLTEGSAPLSCIGNDKPRHAHGHPQSAVAVINLSIT